MQEIIIQNIKKEENTATISLLFPETLKYFSGHFPQMAILPGVVQIHYAMLFAAENFPVKIQISNIKKLRFTKIIYPNKEVMLFLQHDLAANNVFFKYFFDEEIYSSGTFYLRNV